MTTYVLDASALLRYFDDEAGTERIIEIIRACAVGRARVCISAIQWGEIAGRLRKKVGAVQQANILNDLLPSEAEIIPVTGERALRAAEIRLDCGISYADAFAVELALESNDHVLVTADYGFKSVTDLIQLEFLPAK